MRSHRRSTLVVLTLSLGLVSSACSSSDNPPSAPAAPTTQSGAVTPAAGGTAKAGDVTVTLPPDAVAGDGTLTVRRTANPPFDLPVATEPMGDAITVELAGTTLKGQADIGVPVPSDVDGVDWWPVLLWQDGAGSYRPLPLDWAPGQPTATAHTDHFSAGIFAKIDVKKWTADRSREFLRVFSGRSDVAQPKCGDEQAARANGVTVTSDGGDTVKWCFGIDGARRIFRIGNNRRTYTQLTFPTTWKVLDGGGGGFSLDALDRGFGTSLLKAATPRGLDVRVVSGGDTLTFEVPEAGGKLTAEMSILTWALSGIRFGIDTYAWVASYMSAGKLPKGDLTAKRIFDRLVGAEELGGYTEALRACGRAYSDNFTDRPLAATAPDPSVAAVLKTAWGCIPNLMKADYGEAGVTMWGLGTVLSAVATVVGLVLTAVNLLVTGAREILDSFAAFGGKSMPIYDVRITGPAGFDVASLKSAWVPGLCQHPAGNLVDGKLPGIEPNMGEVSLAITDRVSGGKTLVTGDVTGDGAPDAVVEGDCYRGGIGWPPSIHVYSAGPKHVAWIDLPNLEPNATGRPYIEALGIENGRITVKFVTAHPGENDLWPTRNANASLRVQGDKLVVESLTYAN
jgi:hypothetical protein